jgi:hypothetical protein
MEEALEEHVSAFKEFGHIPLSESEALSVSVLGYVF